MNTNLLNRMAAVAALVVFSLAWSSPVRASVILDTHGFEAPFFSPMFNPMQPGTYNGQLEGQPMNPPNETWEQSMDPGTSRAFIQTAVVHPGGGTQAVQLDRGANSNIRWGVPLTGLPSSPTDSIAIKWDMLVRGPVGNPATDFGPFFGVEAYAQPGGGFTVLGSWGVDATTGEVLYQATGSGAFVAPGPTVAFNLWNSFELLLNYASKTYSGFLNGALVFSGIGFVDGAFTTFSDADISGIQAGASASDAARQGTAFFDNFTIAVVPEMPAGATWGILAAIAGCGCWWKRRRGEAAPAA